MSAPRWLVVGRLADGHETWEAVARCREDALYDTLEEAEAAVASLNETMPEAHARVWQIDGAS